MRKPISDLTKPEPDIPDASLEEAGFINSGKSKFKLMVKAFSDELFVKSIHLCDAGNYDGDREITQEHVSKASHIIYGRYSEKPSKIDIFIHIGELVSSAGVGVGGSFIKTGWGALLFGISLALLVILYVSKNSINNKI